MIGQFKKIAVYLILLSIFFSWKCAKAVWKNLFFNFHEVKQNTIEKWDTGHFLNFECTTLIAPTGLERFA